MKNLGFILYFISTSLWAQGSFKLFQAGMSYPGLKSRDVYVYLPDGYQKTKNNYPVLYMQDGQNLFDPNRAYLGQTWNAQSTLNELIAKKVIPPIIVVALDNTPDRMEEYIPERRGDLYLEFLIKKLKPEVDRVFRTRTEARSTGIMGSSLGGLISLHAGLYYTDTFGLIGALSPSIWWNERHILSATLNANRLALKYYLDSGTVGGEKPEDVRDMSEVLTSRQFRHGQNLFVLIQDGADHREYFWAMRFPAALRSLFATSL
jgi:predicted alpha/beta superfamily hydrolase